MEQNFAGTLEQVLTDWEDDPTCSPHRVNSDAMANAMAKILERLYLLAEAAEEENSAS